MQEKYSNQNIQSDSDSVEIVGESEHEYFYYGKSRDSEEFLINHDLDMGVFYLPVQSGFGMGLDLLKEDNLQFIKILKKYNQLESNHNEPLSQETIENIVSDLIYDSDLWDDIFDNDAIFRVLSFGIDGQQISPKDRIERSIDSYMESEQLREQFDSDGDCRRFIRSRIKVFQFYIYLRRCAILYRDTRYKHPLNSLLRFLETPKNYEWLKSKLRVEAVPLRDENWSSGLHEWLTCKDTKEAIMRTAGLRKDGDRNIQSCLSECVWVSKKTDGTEDRYFCSEFNWLDLQFLLRKPNKYVIFCSKIKTIENGHCGGVNKDEFPSSALKGKCTARTVNSPMSEKAFHEDLNFMLHASRTINEFLDAVHNKYEYSIFNDDTDVQPVQPESRRFLVDGTPTDDQTKLQNFKKKLVDPHRFFYHCVRDMNTHERVARETAERSNHYRNYYNKVTSL